ncbi:hypothetical protein [Chamaesiphon minutus]|uniref:Uncharacterized protein n=1 Tax=Chamaesiphon minutus (strain ATCC 27169 / PCC 6605) TaxID=1173020 RepID=K9UDH1_CHAP6|nr:hypothetical protein [Chamaesiphon minutus]AFY92698.1 hypothetical protein Cha6605_1539 [Chamaesiphon minutus PCC 6605]
MNVPLKLWRLGKAHAWRTMAGMSIVGLLAIGSIQLPTSNSQSMDRAIGQSPRFAKDLPIAMPIVSSDPASERADLSTTSGAAVEEEQPVRLNSARIALKDAQVAVSLSQAQLAQARINLSEFKAKHDKAKILSAQGKVSRKQADLALASYKLAQLQHSSAAIGLRDSHTQLIAAKAEVRSLGRKANSVKPM